MKGWRAVVCYGRLSLRASSVITLLATLILVKLWIYPSKRNQRGSVSLKLLNMSNNFPKDGFCHFSKFLHTVVLYVHVFFCLINFRFNWLLDAKEGQWNVIDSWAPLTVESGEGSILQPHSSVATTSTLTSNDVTSVRWLRLYPGYFGFIFEREEEVEEQPSSHRTHLPVTHFTDYSVVDDVFHSVQ